jgi:hypothetical protein
MRHNIVVRGRRSLAWLVLAASLGVLAPLQPRQPPASVGSSAVASVSSATDVPMGPSELCWGCGH